MYKGSLKKIMGQKPNDNFLWWHRILRSALRWDFWRVAKMRRMKWINLRFFSLFLQSRNSWPPSSELIHSMHKNSVEPRCSRRCFEKCLDALTLPPALMMHTPEDEMHSIGWTALTRRSSNLFPHLIGLKWYRRHTFLILSCYSSRVFITFWVWILYHHHSITTTRIDQSAPEVSLREVSGLQLWVARGMSLGPGEQLWSSYCFLSWW